MTAPIRRSRLLVRTLCVATLAGLTLGVLPQPTSAAPMPAAPALPQDVIGLRQGATGSDVVAVQRALLAAGVQVPGGADGVFGPATRSALTAFQSRQGLPTSGEVDSATASALKLTNASTPQAASSGSSAGALAVGAQGAAVIALQKALIAAGVWVAGGADGDFGPATKTAVTNFQRWNGLDTTGTVTSATSKALGLDGSAPAAAPSPAPAAAPAASGSSQIVGLRIGSVGPAVKALQTALIAAGITVRGGADGAFGPMTRDALVSFQRANGLASSGTVDQATADELEGAPATPAPAAPAADANPYVGMTVGATGDRVKELQRALMNTGLVLRGGADGVFGNATKATLVLFQSTNGTPQSGAVSAEDASTLGLGSSNGQQGITRPDGFPVYGERGARVTTLQRSLLNAGIRFAGGADGHFGAATAGAIMSFQRREGLPVTGKVDQTTADRLGNAAAPAPATPSASSLSIDVFPVQGRCWFGDTWHAPRGGGRLHIGTDIIAASGNLLYAAVDGKVSKVYTDFPGALAGNGLRIEQADGSYFTYLHLESLADGIEVGVPVTAGQVVGYVGNTGNSATPHLHFEAHPADGSAINPYSMLKAIDACNVTAARS